MNSEEMDPALIKHVTGQTLRALRERKGIAQERLALEAGIGRSHMGGLERGLHNASIVTIVRLLPHLGVSLAEFGQEFCKQARRARRTKRS